MEIDTRRFNADVRKFGKQMKVSVAKATQLAALKVFAGVVRRTPIDTKVARGSWTVGIGGKPQYYVAKPGLTESQVLARSALIRASKNAKVIYISNYAHYIGYLENGYSQQAPTGMAALTLLEVQQELSILLR